ncbi:MAG: phosphoribosylamine--glycine ligase [Bacteroidetes bacterium]|nr:phosphoribosylamine--glycine ligase [Bacteroidota bacterium]
MKIAIVGSGGREHALGWKLSQSPGCTGLYFLPGNGGTSQLGTNIPVKVNEISRLVETIRDLGIGLVVIGPEEPLVLGLADELRKKGIPAVGPDSWCSQLEGSKSFAKAFMQRHQIPTAGYRIFYHQDRQELERFLHASAYPLVMKADGLAAGKGVIIPTSYEEASEAVRLYFDNRQFGSAGTTLVIEEFMAGEEATLFVLTDGIRWKLLPVAQDHKRIGDGDTGKNTGGMGAYAPAPVVDDHLLKQIEQTIVKPTIEGLASEGHPYNGILYVGLMITPEGPKVVEYNVRFGDPECQVEMMLVESDLLPVMTGIANFSLPDQIQIKPGYASVVVAAAAGYPDEYEKGNRIRFDGADSDHRVIFHAGTQLSDNGVVTSGGRVLNSCAYGPTLEESLKAAYDHLKTVSFEGMHFRHDIGKKGLNRLI